MTNKMNRRQFVASAAAATGAVAAGLYTPTIVKAASNDKWGDLVGRLVYDGKPPERTKLKVDKDVDCCGKFDIRDESLMVGEDGGLANAYVYCCSRRIDICPELEEGIKKQVVLDNRDCIFKPHCLKIWYSKQELSIVNSDPVAQNIAFSPLGDLAANIVLPAPPDKAAKATWTFKRAQNLPVPIACNYHPWESAFILPLDHPYVNITKEDGRFRISKLPVGKLEFQFWQERAGYIKRSKSKKGRLKMTIKPGTNDLGTIKLAASMFKKK
jgi:hypothetical protein